MYYVMHSQLIIDTKDGKRIILGGGSSENNGAIESIETEESVKEMGSTCTVVIPRNITAFEGKSIREYLSPGDRAYVYFGYDTLHLEFSGYLLDIPATAPIRLELADEFYPLRKNSFTKSYSSVTLKQLLNDIAPGYNIVCPDVNLGKYIIDKSSTYQELKKINEKYGFFSYLKAGTLYCQFAYDVRGSFTNEHTYYLCDDRTGKTVKRLGNIRKNDLKYKRIDALDIRVEVYSSPPTGKKIKVVAGSQVKDANVHKLHLPGSVTEADARVIAGKLLSSLTFAGFRGSITGYGEPRTKAGDALNLVDFDYPDHNGKYLIEKVRARYDYQGIERENTLSYKI